MAKLEIDERAWSDPRLKIFKRAAGIRHDHTAMGYLAALWHCSQELLKVYATADDIDTWLAVSGKKGAKIRSALLHGNYLSREKELYRIAGNERRLVAIKAKRLRARNAAEKRWKGRCDKAETQEKSKLSTASAKHATSMQQASKSKNAQSNASASAKHSKSKCSTQCNRNAEIKRVREVESKRVLVPSEPAAQNLSAGQPKQDLLFPSEAAQSKAHSSAGNSPVIDFPAQVDPAPQKSKNGAQNLNLRASDVVKAYCQFYKQKFNQSPTIMGPEAAAAKRLAKDVGVQKAIDLIESYLQMNDAWFIKNDYRLAILCQNVNKVSLYREQGIALNNKTAHEIEAVDNNANVTNRVMQRFAARGGDDW